MEKTILEVKESPAVQAHLTMLQGIIKRMGKNSMQCKQWCIAIETIFFAIAREQMNWWLFGLAVAVAMFFFIQDAGYLAFGRYFRKQQEEFVNKINSVEAFEKDVYFVKTLKGCKRVCGTLKAMKSVFVWPCYILSIGFMLCYMVLN